MLTELERQAVWESAQGPAHLAQGMEPGGAGWVRPTGVDAMSVLQARLRDDQSVSADEAPPTLSGTK